MVIQDLIATIKTGVLATPDGDLRLDRRAALRASLAALADARTSYARRVRLNAMCVRRVLNRWRERFPNDDGVERMLQLDEDVVAGETGPDAARGLNGSPANIGARRAFWLWYLDEAMPEIYALP